MFRKRKALKQELEVFKKTVGNLFDGIHKLDELLERIDSEHAYAYSNLALVERSMQDILSTCLVYRKNHFFHMYNVMKIDNCLQSLDSLWKELADRSQELDSAIHAIALGKGLRDRYAEAPDCDPEELNEMNLKLTEGMFKGEEIRLQVHLAIIAIRSVLLVLRDMVSQDMFAILLGADIKLMHPFYADERRVGKRIDLFFDTANEAKSTTKKSIKEGKCNGI